jgi:hypothetical protein
MRQFVERESGAVRRTAPAPNASYSAGGYRGSARAHRLATCWAEATALPPQWAFNPWNAKREIAIRE